MKRGTTEIFIEKARKVHGDKYDYSKVEYVNNKTKVCIICPEHGEFWQTPGNHLNGSGCPNCGITSFIKKKTFTTTLFSEKAKLIHQNKYDYSKVQYENTETKVCIICPEHGEFWQTPHSHLSGEGCPHCANEKKKNVKKLFLTGFIERAKKIHGKKYDYSKTLYVNNRTKVCIICPEHGEFWQIADYHLSGCGCPKCGLKTISERKKKTKEQFLEKAAKVHNGKYDYSKVEYVDRETKVCIICPKHGEFWQTPHNHENGQGCPRCGESKIEAEIRNFLIKNKINFEQEKQFDWLLNERGNRMKLDFYLPEHNKVIECQGKQHFEPVDFSGDGYESALERFEDTKKSDETKKKLCEERGIKVVYFSKIKNTNDSDIITNKKVLLKEIKNDKR